MIFELDSVRKLKDMDMFKLGLFYLFIWATLFLIQVLILKFVDSTDVYHLGIPAFSVFLCFFVLPLPIKLFYAETRFTILEDIWNIAIAPIGKLRFMQFFIADIMCSMVRPLLEFPQTICFLLNGYF
jgi:hypothetical protein